ncbi:hypothetical protein SAMN05216526_1555 [Ectothiorhodosinus mongolicus]|uniref:Uncharacterized protein n=1 Tax=Ectothiorhodosinus mongolicus TaxID=233100 RepID=A0A1R3W3A3_9GAMM|nr:hypothetical protein SAMN05216526_1555 [Ectothiorhodosinus mongolicus]
MDAQRIKESFAFDLKVTARLQQQWVGLIEQSVWGEIKSEKIGALGRLRKRLLELGENLASVTRSRQWIPSERERVKSAMAASLNLRDSLQQFERLAQTLNGGADFPAFERDFLQFRSDLLRFIEHHEAIWCDLLESQY